ncbi:MAG: hypothetical protein ACXIVD_18155, partial [Salinarimonas sp.]
FRASSATFALNSGACCLRFDISDLLLIEEPQTAKKTYVSVRISGSGSISLNLQRRFSGL